MAGIGKFKLSDAVKPPSDKLGSKKSGKPKPGQTHGISETKTARNAEGSTRDRAVDIGRGGKQGGRQGSA